VSVFCCFMVFLMVSVCCQGVVSGFECGVSVPSGFWCGVAVL